MTARYFVYENWVHDRARVHLAHCGYCQDGRGVHGSSSTHHGRWHGPYADRDSAFRAASTMGRNDTRACPNCNP